MCEHRKEYCTTPLPCTVLAIAIVNTPVRLLKKRCRAPLVPAAPSAAWSAGEAPRRLGWPPPPSPTSPDSSPPRPATGRQRWRRQRRQRWRRWLQRGVTSTCLSECPCLVTFACTGPLDHLSRHARDVHPASDASAGPLAHRYLPCGGVRPLSAPLTASATPPPADPIVIGGSCPRVAVSAAADVGAAGGWEGVLVSAGVDYFFWAHASWKGCARCHGRCARRGRVLPSGWAAPRQLPTCTGGVFFSGACPAGLRRLQRCVPLRLLGRWRQRGLCVVCCHPPPPATPTHPTAHLIKAPPPLPTNSPPTTPPIAALVATVCTRDVELGWAAAAVAVLGGRRVRWRTNGV